MATQLKETKPATSTYRELQRQLGASDAPWLDALRSSALQRFEEIGFPSVKDEEWKYTNVAPIAKIDFKSGAASTPDSDLLAFQAPEARESQLVFVNGVFDHELSSVSALPQDVVAVDLADAVKDENYSELIRTHLARSADHIADGLTALNTAFISSGAFVYIPRDVVVTTPLHLLFISDGPQSVNFPRILVIADENSQASLIETYVGKHETQYFTNTVVEVVVKNGARLEHHKVQREDGQAFHIATTAAELGRNASYDATTITLGAQLSRHGFSVTMDHEGAECWVDGLYLVTDNQHADTHSVIDHRQPHGTSHQTYKGILDGKARAVFNGKIFVRHNAQKTDAMQTNKNLLLSSEARVDTKPQLEILADDVKCAHGAAVGQIDQEELFYLETRGIHPELGRNLLTYGFAEEVIEKIKIESIKAKLEADVLNRLQTRLEV